MRAAGAMLTVVIPVFNRAGVVSRTLDSVYAQSLRPLRLVLVDNGSTDGSAEIVSRWADEHRAVDFDVFVLSEARRGAAAARNRGLAAVDTEWTLFFDSDDVMLPGHLERVAEGIEAHPEADMLGWDVMGFTDDGRERVLPFEPEYIAWHNLMHGSLATQRYCARTELLRRSGGWCESLSTWDDIELGTRLLCLYPRIAKIEGAPTVKLYRSEESVTGVSFAASMPNCLRALAAIRCNYGRLGALSHVAMKRAILAADCVREGRKDAAGVFVETVKSEHRWRNRLALRLAYRWRLMGLRGAARLFKPLLR